MRNIVLGLTAAALALGATTPVFANESTLVASQASQQYTDVVPSWAADYRAAENITRAEFSVALVKALAVMEQGVSQAINAGDSVLYYQLAEQQAELLQALARLDALEAEKAIVRNNYVAIGASYVLDRDGDTADTSVEISAKIQALELTDKLAISIRPFINTNTEFGAAATLDFDVLKNLEVYAGAGAAYRADQDVLGGLTGFDNNAVGYGTAGVTLNLSDKTLIDINTKVPFNSGEGKEITVKGSLGFRF